MNDGQKTTVCKSCGERIMFIDTPNGKRHPVNVKNERVWTFIGGMWFLINAHKSHFATCPHADQHRKRG